jgi:AraC-like DNA-binding protein
MTSVGSEPTYLVRVASLLLDDAARAGIDREALLSRAGIEPAVLHDPDARLPLGSVVAVARAVVDAANDPAFGVRAGAARRARDAGLVGYAMLHSANLRDALTRLVRYMRIVGDHNRLSLDEAGDIATIDFEGPTALVLIVELMELDVAWIVAVLREITGRDVVPVEVRFPNKEPAHLQALRAHCRCPLQFEAAHLAIVLRRADLDLPVTAADATLAGYLDRLADDAVKALGTGDTTTGRLRQVLWSRLSDGAPTLSTAASAMAVSPRTLQRRLTDEGTTFAEALSALRHDLAVSLLRDKKLAVYEIGFLLGYADQSAFHRAFRRSAEHSRRLAEHSGNRRSDRGQPRKFRD